MLTIWKRFNAAEMVLTLHFNRGCRRRLVARFFGAISRVGDGMLWYALIALLPLVYGWPGLHAGATMLGVGLLSLSLYHWLKKHTTRPRPRDSDARILRTTAPLDQFSFPSGHTLHAVGFTTVAVSGFPELAWVLLPLTVLIAASRVVLGLHYPSDVAAGALVGFLVAQVGLSIAGLF